ncbi:hypothetical protein HZ326_26946 [Fusarium oxysporum f. sp. albedinis]|nr:hypothetical protein HZ326_26946 [Fusarium oxysporum f. sp. albedinis]
MPLDDRNAVCILLFLFICLACELLRQAQRRAEEAEQCAETSEAQMRPMTLDEYIAACHTFLFSRLSIETDPKLALRGSIIRFA